MKKILLVYPRNFREINKNLRMPGILKKEAAFMSSTLPTIAALTPKHYYVEIIDETLKSIDFNKHYDIVGISGLPTQFPRAKELFEIFKKQGTLVVMGGASVYLSPERWKPYADVLIIGEAERIWPKFLNDFEAGNHLKEYVETEKNDLSLSPIPDYSKISSDQIKKYISGTVQTSRGCPFECEFCSVTSFLGKKMRYKSIANIMIEIKNLHSLGFRTILLADDNFSVNRKIAKDILQAIRDFNRIQKYPISFATQLSIDTADDKEFLELAAEAGLHQVLIGVESPDKDCLMEMKKFHNLKRDVETDLKKFHEHGIVTLATTIVGLDHDTLNSFQKHFDAFNNQGLPRIVVSPLQAADGTPLKERMIKEKRYVDWEEACTTDKNFASIVRSYTVIPKNFSVNQLRQGLFWLFWNFYKPENFEKRLQIFFKTYDDCKEVRKYKALTPPLNFENIGIVYRLLIHVLFQAHSDERKAFWSFLKLARKSKLPNKYSIVLLSYLAFANFREFLRVEEPGIEDITYPTC